jgi:mannose-6-phosphate isomerase-like protein (cupin superfamily)
MGGAIPSAFWLLSNLVIVHVAGVDTAGRFCLVEVLTPPDDWTPLHLHRDDSQTTYVLEGELTVYTPGSARALGPGDCIHQPPGVPQTEHVTSSVPARVLDINSPAGFDLFVEAAGRPAEALTLPPPDESEPDLEPLIALAAEYGIDVLGPPGALP